MNLTYYNNILDYSKAEEFKLSYPVETSGFSSSIAARIWRKHSKSLSQEWITPTSESVAIIFSKYRK